MSDSSASVALSDLPRSTPKPSYKAGPRSGKHRLSPLTQALDLKDVAYRNGTDPATPVHIQAALMRAWADLHEITMAIRGQGKPKPIEARNAVSKRKGRDAAAPVAAQAKMVNGAS